MRLNNRKITLLLVSMLIISLLISACGESEPEVDIEAQRTGFAQTANAQATMTYEAQPTATETPVPSPTFTNTPEPTITPEETPTETNGEEPPVTGGSNIAQLIVQVPENDSVIRPEESFTVTWTLENRGTATWTTNYYVEFFSGNQIGATDRVYFWLSVPPGTSLPISVDFTAPEAEGTVQSQWKLYNASDVAFYDIYLSVEISQTGGGEGPTPTETPEPTATPEP